MESRESYTPRTAAIVKAVRARVLDMPATVLRDDSHALSLICTFGLEDEYPPVERAVAKTSNLARLEALWPSIVGQIDYALPETLPDHYDFSEARVLGDLVDVCDLLTVDLAVIEAEIEDEMPEGPVARRKKKRAAKKKAKRTHKAAVVTAPPARKKRAKNKKKPRSR
jgi:hypothetical protein